MQLDMLVAKIYWGDASQEAKVVDSEPLFHLLHEHFGDRMICLRTSLALVWSNLMM